MRIPHAAARILVCLAALLPRLTYAEATFDDARLLRFPDIHGDTVAFSYAGDIFTVPASGGAARRLTSGEGLELFPRFSPDGKWIAFTGHYDGTSDVYVMPAAGGEPRRLTWYPSQTNSERLGWDNMVLGFTPEGKILFRGQRNFINGFVGEPYTVSPEGGPVERFPLPESGAISFSPDGKRLAYTRIFRDFRTWKRYQGGMAQDVWLHDLASKATTRATDWIGTDTQPMWIGDAVYFLSDREDWKLNLWRYDLATKQASRVTRFTEYDVKWPHAGSGQIVFENGGSLYRLDPRGGEPQRLKVSLSDDRRLARPRYVGVGDRVTSYSLSPGGQRVAFAARGDVFTVPAEHGNTRNITESQGVREKEAAWSPDGKWIAYVSDQTGEEEVYVAPQDGKGAPQQLTTGSSSFHFSLVWSPDSKKLAWADRGQRLHVTEVAAKKTTPVDRGELQEITEYTFSPDSEWLAYTKRTDNGLTAIFLYGLAGRKVTQATEADGSNSPAFDPDGRYLFFLSEREINPTLGSFELSYTVNRTSRPQALVLRADLPSPFAPKSDEAKPAEPKDETKAAGKEQEKEADKKPDTKKKEPFRIDLEGLRQRVVPFPVTAGNYAAVSAGRGKVFWLSGPLQTLTDDEPAKASLRVYDLEKRKEGEVMDGLQSYELAPDQSKLLVSDGKEYKILEPKEGATAERALDLSGLKMQLDPKAEWAQIFREAWRIQRDFFYLPDMGKIDWPAMRRRYESLLPYVSHRVDLTLLLGELAGELGSGHSYVGGGDLPKPEKLPVGVLGAVLRLDGKAWRIDHIYPGETWTEKRRSPLRDPGVKVEEGEYLLAIDGKDLGPGDEPYRLLAGKADRVVSLLVGKQPVRSPAREVSVRTLADEDTLRYQDWVERNRVKVDEATKGRVGYLHIPDMGGNGLQEFIRQYYPQIRKEALVVDVRANGGGFVSEMILERLKRVVVGMGSTRDARPNTYPQASFSGPMVALINAYSASDGDIFPYFFREYGLGPLIGTRTWGGVVGIRGAPNLVDGGYVFVPEFGTFSVKGEWIIENEGVHPDIEVDNLPADELAGKDAQLERAIAEVLKRLETWPRKVPSQDPPSLDLRTPRPITPPR